MTEDWKLVCNYVKLSTDLTESITRNDIEALQQLKIIYNSCVDIGKKLNHAKDLGGLITMYNIIRVN